MKNFFFSRFKLKLGFCKAVYCSTFSFVIENIYIKTDWFGTAGVDEGVLNVLFMVLSDFILESIQRIWNFFFIVFFILSFQNWRWFLLENENIFKASFNLHTYIKFLYLYKKFKRRWCKVSSTKFFWFLKCIYIFYRA